MHACSLVHSFTEHVWDTGAPSRMEIAGAEVNRAGPCRCRLFLVQWRCCAVGTSAPTLSQERGPACGLLWGPLVAAFLVGDRGSEVQQWPVLLWRQAEPSVWAGTSEDVSRGRVGTGSVMRRPALSWWLLFLYSWYLCFRVSLLLLTSTNTFTQDWSCDLCNLKFISAVW